MMKRTRNDEDMEKEIGDTLSVRRGKVIRALGGPVILSRVHDAEIARKQAPTSRSVGLGTVNANGNEAGGH